MRLLVHRQREGVVRCLGNLLDAYSTFQGILVSNGLLSVIFTFSVGLILSLLIPSSLSDNSGKQ